MVFLNDSQHMNHPYFPLFVIFALATVVILALLLIASIFRQSRVTFPYIRY